jgi:hypothetical protein
MMKIITISVLMLTIMALCGCTTVVPKYLSVSEVINTKWNAGTEIYVQGLLIDTKIVGGEGRFVLQDSSCNACQINISVSMGKFYNWTSVELPVPVLCKITYYGQDNYDLLEINYLPPP